MIDIRHFGDFNLQLQKYNEDGKDQNLTKEEKEEKDNEGKRKELIQVSVDSCLLKLHKRVV